MEIFQRVSRGRFGRGSPSNGRSAEGARQTSTNESQRMDKKNNGRNQDVAEQEQQEAGAEEQGSSSNMSQQINEAIQPVIGNLQEQITQTVREQVNEAGRGVSADGASSALSLDNLGPIGETLQSSLNNVVDRLQPFFVWVLELLQKLWNWLTSLVGGGEGEESEGEEESEEAAEAAA